MKMFLLPFALFLAIASLLAEPLGDSDNPLNLEPSLPEEEVAFLGLLSSDLSPVVSQQLGLSHNLYLSVARVIPGSPADKAGVKQYDILMRLDDQILVNQGQLVELVRSCEVGQPVSLIILRRGKEKTLKVKLGRMKKRAGTRSFNQAKEFDKGLLFPDATILEDRFRKQIERHMRPLGQGNRFPEPISPEVMERFDADGDGKLSPLERDKARDEGALRKVEPNLGLNFDFGSSPNLQKMLRDAHKRGGASSWSSVSGSAKTKIVNSDVDGSYEFTSEDGKKHFRVISLDGEVLFDGPVDTEEERAVIPGGLLERLESLEGSIRINIRQFGADLKLQPNKKKEKSSL
jgi:hypothetical protein